MDKIFMEFLNKHMNHEKFDLVHIGVSVGYGMSEKDVCKLKAMCEHLGIKLEVSEK